MKTFNESGKISEIVSQKIYLDTTSTSFSKSMIIEEPSQESEVGPEFIKNLESRVRNYQGNSVVVVSAINQDY